ncbi:TPA: hypothetical protein IAA86_08805 [Candidatus Galligastranaerophilus intestinavium]|uniref:Uncharacterized protein n=1 Tax=Candidatus Galligastranaerophilus intestinavium TaxID=2840836 RepID=A0A9D1FJR7_9BACT|nr:hypothetical protein [Candidatus Galligastranaerophilus intestinavium]
MKIKTSDELVFIETNRWRRFKFLPKANLTGAKSVSQGEDQNDEFWSQLLIGDVRVLLSKTQQEQRSIKAQSPFKLSEKLTQGFGNFNDTRMTQSSHQVIIYKLI